MERIIIAPSKYVQGPGAINNLSNYTNILGKNPLVVADDFVLELVMDDIMTQYDDLNIWEFNGECSKVEINKIKEIIERDNIDTIIGIGGGKTFDTVKAVGHYCNIPVVIVPTIASTDAPTSALAVIYTEDGVFEEYLFVKSNPNVVLVDSNIIASAPERLLASGIGDALSTYFEARACKISNATSMAGGKQTKCSIAISKLCYDTLLIDGVDAYISVKNNVVTPALENIIEANTLLSGIGFESGGLAAAHSIHNGFTAESKFHHFTHGEKVAFGTLVQLILENDHENYKLAKELCKKVNLPICFKDFEYALISDDAIMYIAKHACAKDETIHNMPIEINPEIVFNAIKLADMLGQL